MIAVAVLCYAALGSVVTFLPDYVPRLGRDATLVGLAVGAPAITGAAARPLGGRWADRHGPAAAVIGGAVIMAVGTLPGLLPRMPLLLASRLVVGVGEAAMMAAAVLWLLRWAGPAHRGRATRPRRAGQLRRPRRRTTAGPTRGSRPPRPGSCSRRLASPARGRSGGDPALSSRRVRSRHTTGLVGVALSSTLPVAVSALVLLALGQGLAIPALGTRALSAVPPADHGAASGLFFGYFDLGVGLGGPAVGFVAERADPGAALLVAAGAVLAAAPAALLTPSKNAKLVSLHAPRAPSPR